MQSVQQSLEHVRPSGLDGMASTHDENYFLLILVLFSCIFCSEVDDFDVVIQKSSTNYVSFDVNDVSGIFFVSCDHFV
jgi:hypothetical protein